MSTYLYLLPGPVGCSRVRHGVPVVPVGDHLEDERALGGAVLGREADGLAHSQDVHPVDLGNKKKLLHIN